jgi:small-conductance mechanosensitive channel
MRPLILIVLLALLSGSASVTARAAAPTAAVPTASAAQALTPAQAQQLLAVLNDPAKRAQFTTTLQEMLKALPATAQAATAQAATAQAAGTPVTGGGAAPAHATAAVPKAGAKPAAVQVAPNGLGVQLVTEVGRFFSSSAAQLATTVRVITRYHAILDWIDFARTNPTERGLIFETVWRAAMIVVVALGVERGVERALRRPRQRLADYASAANSKDAAIRPGAGAEPEEVENDTPEPPAQDPVSAGTSAPLATASKRHRRLRGAWTALRRLPFVLARLLLAMLPVGAFLLAGYGLVATPLADVGNTRLAAAEVIEAYAIARLLMIATRALVAPAHPRLRLLHVSDASAADIVIWMRRLVVIAAAGAAAANLLSQFGLSRGGHDALIKLVALIDHILLLVVVVRYRARVAARIRPAPDAKGTIALGRRWLARAWHWIAIFYIVALWIVYAVEVSNGFFVLTHLFLLAAGVLVAARIVAMVALGALDRAFRFSPEVRARHPGLEKRANRYYPLLRQAVTGVISVLTVLAILQVWGLDVLSWFGRNALGGRLASALGTIVIMVAIAVAVWEVTNASFEQRVALLAESEQPVRAARLRTLLPILRTTLLIVIVVVIGLTALSEIGVNIAPLLAGAGIVGVAIGFGSQKLVQDLITGLFLLMENAMQVGDWVTVSGLSGSVENLSIRTLRLRAGDGSVHLIPFSSVTSVTNTNRGVGNAAVSVTVSAREDTDRVSEVLREIVAGMRADDAFSRAIRSDLQLWGVDRVDAVSATIVGQVVCTDSGRWNVQREFNRRMKRRFQELGIEMPPPTQIVRVERTHRDDRAPDAEPAAKAAPS